MVGWVLLSLLGSMFTAHAWYEPSVQRWLNRDPLNEPGFGLRMSGAHWAMDTSLDGQIPEQEVRANLYAFVLNDPVGYSDPDGRSIFRPIKAWWCRRKMDKWYKQCIKDIPPCTRGLGQGSKGPCPYDGPGQDPDNHWFVCEVNRVEKIKECADKSKEMFKACMGVVTSPPTPKE